MLNAEGNLIDLAIDGKFDIIVHGCNCFNTMGGGIAKEIKSRIHSAYLADAGTVKGDIRKLGSWSESSSYLSDTESNGFIIINAYTQYDMSKGQDVFEYGAFELILRKLSHIFPNKRFGFPMIGMGLAGGDSICILKMLNEFSDKIVASGGSVTLVHFKN